MDTADKTVQNALEHVAKNAWFCQDEEVLYKGKKAVVRSILPGGHYIVEVGGARTRANGNELSTPWTNSKAMNDRKDNALFILKGARIPAEQLGKGKGYIFYVYQGKKYGVPDEHDYREAIKDAGLKLATNAVKDKNGVALKVGDRVKCKWGMFGWDEAVIAEIDESDRKFPIRVKSPRGEMVHFKVEDVVKNDYPAASAKERITDKGVIKNMSAQQVVTQIELLLGTDDPRDQDDALQMLQWNKDKIKRDIGDWMYKDLYRRANNGATSTDPVVRNAVAYVKGKSSK